MEPITLCGLMIVMLGAWIECEDLVRAVKQAVCRSSLFRRMAEICAAEGKTACVNRYAPYPR